ncbi:peptidoglycan recognition protein family protein [Acanthopleuribacter pedis]|uniref:N-acetylmuramoyl-L-alanine amidase n=1 Tax=Acanthopleuribacter pedis TaxID=442870 RepID=A0A8J7U123_9BACT|nr:N-acetylmuramoyl-L-alanine amidase [Acanthopleuribacter pedis]MBO1317703.1 N-acetylmuramoyl-L-alanine amidase [Acanthopleuribacter pedis]
MKLFVRLGLCVLLAATTAMLFPRIRYQYLVVHHTASDTGNLHSVRRGHWARGWFDAGYHLILSNGSTAVPAGDLEPSLRYWLGTHSVATRSKRHNVLGLHLAVVGNYEQQPPSPATRAHLAHALKLLSERYGVPSAKILLHRDCSATACPGRNIQRADLVRWVDQESGKVTPAVAARQRAVLAKTLTAPGILFPLFLGGLVSIWGLQHRWRMRRRRISQPTANGAGL